MKHKIQCSCGARLAVPESTPAVRCPKCDSVVSLDSATMARRPTRSKSKHSISKSPQPVPRGEDPKPRLQHPDEANVLDSNSDSPESTWQPIVEETIQLQPTRKFRPILLLIILVAPIAVIATLLSLPLMRTYAAEEVVAQQYLAAIRDDDWIAANKLSAIEAHQHIDRFGDVQLRPGGESVSGNFVALARFHADVNEKYSFNESTARFQIRDPFSAGMEALSELEKSKKRIEESESQPKRRRGSFEDQLLDDVIGRYSAIMDLGKSAGGILSSETLAPTYEDLLSKKGEGLTEQELTIANLFARNPHKWQRLLGRSFLTLPGDQPFDLDIKEIDTTVVPSGESLEDGGLKIRLQIIRFRMGTIDSGWKIWEVQATNLNDG